MARIWNLRMNLDELNALAAGLFTDAEKAQAFHGLVLGCNGGTLPEHCSGAVAEAFKVSTGWRVEASNYMQKKVDAGNASAISRRKKTGTAQPHRTNPEQCSSGVQAQVQHRVEQAPNQSYNLTSTNTPLPPTRKGKRFRAEDLGAYPPELEEAHTLWRGLLRELKGEEIQSAYPPDKRFLPAAVGTKEASWRAWQPHLTKTVAGHPVTNADILEALNLWAGAKVKRAKAGEGLACKMLPAMLNSADFVDGVVAAVRARLAQEVPHAS